MIDWAGVGANTLWILGCALILASLSYASWEASIYREPIGSRLRRQGLRTALSLGAVIFSIGMAGSSRRLLEIALWSVLAVMFLFQWLAARPWKRHDTDINR
jgi:hypothetical protein